MVEQDRSPGKWIRYAGQGKILQHKLSPGSVMAPSEARGQTAIPLASHSGGKPFRDGETYIRKDPLLYHKLPDARGMGRERRRFTQQGDGENRQGDKHAGDGVVV
jgi:hypothetical protein